MVRARPILNIELRVLCFPWSHSPGSQSVSEFGWECWGSLLSPGGPFPFQIAWFAFTVVSHRLSFGTDGRSTTFAHRAKWRNLTPPASP